MTDAVGVGRALLAIPARAGSKRLARKNLALLGGVPMIAHTIQAARASGLSDRVFVCTEDDEIADVSAAHGASVFRIPATMAGDEVSSTVPCLALYDSLVSEGAPVEYLFNLQPSSPLRTGDDIRAALDSLESAGADFVVSVTPIDPHYFHWALAARPEGWEMYFGAEFHQERTRLPPVSRPNGAIKLGRARKVKETGHFFGRPLEVSEMPEVRSIHVATGFDLTCAQAMLADASVSRVLTPRTTESTNRHPPPTDPVELTGSTIRLETFQDKHLHDEAYLGWLRDYDVVKTINRRGYLRPVSFAEVERYCSEVMASPTDLFFAIRHFPDDVFVGTLRVSRIDSETRSADIGILIGDKAYWGRGVATDAIGTIGAYLFDRMGMRRLTAGLMSINPAMLRVFEKVGFQREGVFREQDLFEGRFVDHVYLGCLQHEFRRPLNDTLETE